jgi:organic radical activating enzyme
VIERYRTFPRTVALETSSFCNARCVMCPHSDMRRKKGLMSWKLFARAIDECAEYDVEKIFLSGFGEPLTDSGLAEKIAYTHKKGLRTSIVTNGHLLDERKARSLIDAGLDEVNISIDGFTAPVYNAIRIGLDFDTVAANIKTLARLKTGERPRLNLEMVVIAGNRNQVDIARKHWLGVVDSLVVRQAQDWAGGIELDSGSYTPHQGASRAGWPPCMYPFTQLSVYWDGTVPVCCLDYEARGKVGVFGPQSLAEIWKGKIMERYRGQHLARKGRLDSPCSHCYYFSVWW